MRPQPHRWIDRLALLPAVAIVVGIAGIVGNGIGDHERITEAWYLIEFPTSDASTAVQVQESITYDFGWSSRHGIFRDVPGIDDRDSIRVSSSSAPDDVTLSLVSGLTRIQIGDPVDTVNQTHAYVIDYSLPVDAVVKGDTFAWNPHGLSWDVPAEHVEAHVVAPNVWEDVRCFVGSEGSQDPCDVEQVEPGHLVASADGLAKREAMTIVATPGAAIDAAPAAPVLPPPGSSNGLGIIRTGLLALLAAGAATVPVSVWSRRRGRDQVALGGPADAAFAVAPSSTGALSGAQAPNAEFRLMDDVDLARMATVEFEAPRSLSAVQGSIVLTESVGSHVFTTWLLEAAGRREVEFDQESEKDAVTLRRGDVDPTGDAASVLAGIFAGRDEVALGSTDTKLNAARTRVTSDAARWLRDGELWDHRATARSGAVVSRGILGAIVSMAVVVLAAHRVAEQIRPGWLIALGAAAFCAGGFLGALVRSWELRVRTPAGSAAWLQVESFRRFLHQSEARHVEAAARAGRLRQYTAWAVALGESAAWTKAVSAASAADPELNSFIGSDMFFATRAATFATMVSTSSSPPSSSGSGGGSFGGGAGGGGGGGGGGSW